jgi:hypothetical protein
MPSDKDSVETAQLEPGADTAPSMANPLEGAVTRDFYVLPIPRYLQHSKARPQQFTLGVNVLFFLISFASYGNVNLCVPILLSLSRHLDVSYAASSKLASFATGGLTLGIFLICPLGDTSRRRPIFLLFTVLGCLASVSVTLCASARTESVADGIGYHQRLQLFRCPYVPSGLLLDTISNGDTLDGQLAPHYRSLLT